MTNGRPDPLIALDDAASALGLDLPDGLTRQVLDLELSADPHGSADERRARLRRLLEKAAGEST